MPSLNMLARSTTRGLCYEVLHSVYNEHNGLTFSQSALNILSGKALFLALLLSVLRIRLRTSSLLV